MVRVKHIKPSLMDKKMSFNKVNSLASGRCSNLKSVIFRHIIQIIFMSTSCKIAFHFMPQNTFDGVMLIQVMAWCHQATNHYLSQCWPRSMSPYGFTKPQWVNTMHVVAWAPCTAWSSADMVQTTDDRHIVIFREYGLQFCTESQNTYHIYVSSNCSACIMLTSMPYRKQFIGLVMPYGDMHRGQHWFRLPEPMLTHQK